MDTLVIDPGQDGRTRVEGTGDGRSIGTLDHLLREPPEATLDAVVVVPVRDEADVLPGFFRSVARQRGENGRPFPLQRLELILLFSHCTDGSAEVAATAAGRFPELRIRSVDIGAAGAGMHVGMARRLLMEAAVRRLEAVAGPGRGVILTTDADTEIAADWLVENLAAIDAGADAVGGQVLMKPRDRAALPPALRRRYLLDHAYQLLVSRLAGVIDPDPDDPLPRHHQHAGASLAVTVPAYRRAGGLPPLATGEDEALFRALKRTGARFRHSVRVRAFTSGRLAGRVEQGLAGTLRRWGEIEEESLVEAPCVVLERLRQRARLRALYHATAKGPGECAALAETIGLEPSWLGERLSYPSPFFCLQEAVERRQPAPESLVPLDRAVHELRRLLGRYEGARPRRSSRQVA